MQSFELLSQKFSLQFEKRHFPEEPSTLYEPNEYFLKLGGKRIRPVLCLMGNELFDEITSAAWEAATAVELFHNFTLIHDDIMDKAPLRRGMETVHTRYNESTALLAGDVMLVRAYDYLNQIDGMLIHPILQLFNQTAREVCEGQQLDMDFEKRDSVSLDEYLRMIELKTSVLLAACLKMGAIIGGAGQRNQDLLFEFGRKLGIAFQIKDDYLDVFGDPEKFGKKIGGDIFSNKKTFLLVHALEIADPAQKLRLHHLLQDDSGEKVKEMIAIYRDCKVDEWALQLQARYLDEALYHLEEIAVVSKRKQPLKELAHFLVQRDY